MLIQLKPQHLAILELELEHLAIEPRIVLEDDAVVVLAFQFGNLSHVYNCTHILLRLFQLLDIL